MSNNLDITEVSFHPVEINNPNVKLLSFASVTFNGQLVVRGIRIFRGRYGLFTSWPKSHSERDDVWYSTTFPITRSLYKYVQHEVLTRFKAEYEVEKPNPRDYNDKYDSRSFDSQQHGRFA